MSDTAQIAAILASVLGVLVILAISVVGAFFNLARIADALERRNKIKELDEGLAELERLEREKWR